jgi:hypothetical protein
MTVRLHRHAPSPKPFPLAPKEHKAGTAHARHRDELRNATKAFLTYETDVEKKKKKGQRMYDDEVCYMKGLGD